MASNLLVRLLELGSSLSGQLNNVPALTCAAHVNIIQHMSKMIQLRNVPDTLHRQLKSRAALAGMALSDYLIREVRKIAAYPSPEEMRERLFHRDPYRGKTSPTELVRAERDAR
jgi:hypothetical protein